MRCGFSFLTVPILIATSWSQILLIMLILWEKLVLLVLHFMLRSPKVGFNVCHVVAFPTPPPPPFACLFLFSYFLQRGLMVLFAENWQELVQKIKAKGMRPGVALKPGTPIEEVYPLVCLPVIFMLLDCVAGFYIVWNNLNTTTSDLTLTK